MKQKVENNPKSIILSLLSIIITNLFIFIFLTYFFFVYILYGKKTINKKRKLNLAIEFGVYIHSQGNQTDRK